MLQRLADHIYALLLLHTQVEVPQESVTLSEGIFEFDAR